MDSTLKTTKPINGTTPTGLPASQRITAPDCPCCRSAETHIYCTRDPLRYCKCRHCGHTWSFAKSF